MPVAVSLMLPYLFGLGGLLLLVSGGLENRKLAGSNHSAMQGLAACLVFGVLINHFLVLLLSELVLSLLVGCTLSMVTLVTLIVIKRTSLFRVSWLLPSLLLYVACLYLVTSGPVTGWDARSIWFLHGKMIFYNGSVDAGGDWTLPSIVFSHTDYPQLVPILAAQVASVAGYWNEYLPKLSLVALLLPAILLLLSTLGRNWRHIVFLLLPILFTGPWLNNGYMDGYLALYAGFGCFFLGKWLDEGKQLDLATGLLSAGVVLHLKNEGLLYVLILSALFCLFLLYKRMRLVSLNGRWREGGVIVSIVISGWILWERKKHLFQLKNDLQLGPESIERVLHRLSEGSLTVILKYLYVVDNINLSLGIFLLSLVYKTWKKERPGMGVLLCGFVAVIYFAGIVTIYLATPFDLESFHLPTGDRTMLPVHIMLLAASYSLFVPCEAKAEASSDGSTPQLR
uniref:Glycosyltransferase RgtA/B/C/D-like domain-containing protein n=1 Tax=Geobacter sp. (strain M21) TaxID=443144 RepID=C6E5V3_GEOSM